MAENNSPSATMNSSVTQMLDEASHALLFFEHFEPLYRKWVGDTEVSSVPTYQQLHAMFYQQNGLNEDKFVHAASTLKEVLEKTRPQHDQQNRWAQNLPSIWSGQGAANALDMITTQLSMANSDINAVQKIQETLEGTSTALRAAVKHKYDVVINILENGREIKWDGKTPEDVDVIIQGARGIGFTTFYPGSILYKIEKIFPGINYGFEGGLSFFLSVPMAGIVTPMSPVLFEIKDHCRAWMDKFKEGYEQKADIFEQACRNTDDLVNQQYDKIIATFSGLNEAPYPCPQSTQPQNPSQQTQPGSPSSPGTSTSTPSTPGLSTTPSSTTTPSAENPLSALSNLSELGTQAASLVTGIGQAVQQGLGQLLGTGDQNIGDTVASTLEQLREEAEKYLDTDGDGTPDSEDEDASEGEDKDEDEKSDDESAALVLGDKSVKLEMGPDGRLKLVLTGADGESKEYRIGLGDNGEPVFLNGEPEGDESAPESTDSGETEQQPLQQPSVAPAAPSGRTEEDGEHRPQSVSAPQPEEEPEREQQPQSPPPAAPIDSGVRLAEAGPL